MDMQGQPIGGSGGGAKVCSCLPCTIGPQLTDLVQVRQDPAGSQNPIHESTGAVASDSLAAESVREGGAFANNPNSAPSGVSGSKSTLANTDTSAATTLDAAPDATAREEREAWDESAALKGAAGIKYAEGLGGQPNLGGTVSEQGFAGAPSGGGTQTGASSAKGGASGYSGSGSGTGNQTGSSSAESGTSGGTSGGTSYSRASGPGGGADASSTGVSGGPSTSSSSNVDAAPTYVRSVLQGGDGKPKGRNLQEGGFKGASENTDYEIGDENDPGRAALGKIEERNAAPVGATGAPQKEFTNEAKYDELKTDEAA